MVRLRREVTVANDPSTSARIPISTRGPMLRPVKASLGLLTLTTAGVLLCGAVEVPGPDVPGLVGDPLPDPSPPGGPDPPLNEPAGAWATT